MIIINVSQHQIFDKHFLGSNNFLNHQIQVERDCKIIAKTLLRVINCPWRIMTVFEFVKCLVSHFENADLL